MGIVSNCKGQTFRSIQNMPNILIYRKLKEMKKMKCLLLLCLVLATTCSYGQTRRAFLEAAEASFSSKDYYSALHYYQNVLDFSEDINVLYKTAEAARLFNSYKRAEEYYTQVVDLQQMENSHWRPIG